MYVNHVNIQGNTWVKPSVITNKDPEEPEEAKTVSNQDLSFCCSGL